MGLPARQRRRLEDIEDGLRSADPRLAAMFAVFGRLTQDEDMPRIEELAHRAAVLALRIRLGLAAAAARLRLTRRRGAGPLARSRPPGRPHRSGSRARRPAGRPPGVRWRPMALFFPLALVMMSLSIYVAVRFGGAPRCAAATAVATAKLDPTSKTLVRSGGSKAGRPCRPALLTPLPIGR